MTQHHIEHLTQQLAELRAENERLTGAIRFALRTYDEGHDMDTDIIEMRGILHQALSNTGEEA